MSIADEAASIRTGSMRAADAVQDAIERAHRLGPRLNAFITIDDSVAMAAAETADNHRSNGEALGRLHGVALAHKDMFNRRGHRCSFGSRLRQQRAPARSATVIERLENAGAITIGSLAMAEFALGPTGHNTTFGHCRNPWDPSRVSGGSSSGPASAVAAGIVLGALGSDTGGSIRIPASCCGLVGLKPTQHRVSVSGVMPLSTSLDCIGPITRSVGDCVLLFDTICDADPTDPHRSSALSRDKRFVKGAVTSFRLVYPASIVARDADASITEALDRAANAFRRVGATLIERPLPDIPHLHALADIVQRSEAAAAHMEILRDHLAAYTPHIRRRIEGGLFVAAPAYVSAVAQRHVHLRAFLETTLRDADALLIPTVGIPVPLIDETNEEHLGALPDLVGRMTYWTRWLNYLGVPSLSIPCGYDKNGMPIGMQLVGRPSSEFHLLAIAAGFEKETPWHTHRAPIK